MSEEKLRTYVCKRARMCTYLMKRGFKPYKVCPDRDNPMYDVFLFTASPELYEAVTEYISKRAEASGGFAAPALSRAKSSPRGRAGK